MPIIPTLSIPLTRPSVTLSPTRGEGRGEGATRRPGVQHLGDVGLIYHRQRLPLGREAMGAAHVSRL